MKIHVDIDIEPADEAVTPRTIAQLLILALYDVKIKSATTVDSHEAK